MRVAVLSDVHANLHALEAVLAAVDREAPDAVWCLGDVVGYGPQPTPCCEAVAARADVCLAGNHDLGALGLLDVEATFSPDAAAAAQWTAARLTDADRRFLAALEPSASLHEAALYHGSPRDPVWEYVLSEESAAAALALTEAPLVLVGHSHVALAIGLREGALQGGLAPAGTAVALASGRWLLNPGSVGQPRDGDPRAAWILLDLERGTAQFRRETYDVEATQREIRAAGLPESLAARLESGI
jgi:predicted phosphodiesterase